MSETTYVPRRGVITEPRYGYRRPAPRHLVEPATRADFPTPGRHIITVTGVTLECTCGLRDMAGALSIYNHAIHHGGAFVTSGDSSIWVDQACRVEGHSIYPPVPEEDSHEQ